MPLRLKKIVGHIGQPESYSKKRHYKFGKTLGAGTFGVVREAIGPEGECAVKIILKDAVKSDEQIVLDELNMLQQLHHPRIVKFYDWFESKTKYYIVTQICKGGELFERICQLGRFTEEMAVVTIREVLEAVAYLHSLNIVHRDLKPENLLYVDKEPNQDLVLADFGIAQHLDSKGTKLTSLAGSFGYVAPEVLNRQGHGKPCDIWSLGVITYTLLCGYSPFRSETVAGFLDEAEGDEIIFHKQYWKDVSDDAKRFINRMLRLYPEDRATAQELLQDEWITGKTANKVDLLPSIRPGFNARSKFVHAIQSVLLAKRLASLTLQEEGMDDGDEIVEVFDVADENESLNTKTESSTSAGNSPPIQKQHHLAPPVNRPTRRKSTGGSRFSDVVEAAVLAHKLGQQDKEDNGDQETEPASEETS